MSSRNRYENTPAFSPDPRGKSAFEGVRPRDIGPAPGVIEHGIVSGDRLDRMATHYYSEDRLWYRLADANFAALYAPDLVFDPSRNFDPAADPLHRTDRVGQSLLIPRAKE